MSDYIAILKEWIVALGEKHEVDPLLLGCLYFISKVSLVICIGWVIKTLRSKKTVMVPVLLTTISFIIPYLYIIIAGRNIPFWIYILILFIFVYGGYTIRRKVMIGSDSSSQ
ncbi:hypothetical protein [Mucilaginibacter endophyticus]|uniref:hypothetical protein n=1 Tax=Mucilaginibacter endophyticus TaxID=2675003 RepID=UPI000E0CFBB9|nr:hypothetical protein [Mucilaginibacter endophyticus]